MESLSNLLLKKREKTTIRNKYDEVSSLSTSTKENITEFEESSDILIHDEYELFNEKNEKTEKLIN